MIKGICRLAIRLLVDLGGVVRPICNFVDGHPISCLLQGFGGAIMWFLLLLIVLVLFWIFIAFTGIVMVIVLIAAVIALPVRHHRLCLLSLEVIMQVLIESNAPTYSGVTSKDLQVGEHALDKTIDYL
jgi:hypothetical protein